MRIVVRTLLALVAVVALAVAVVWPWPAPEVDWRTPADQALAAGDCKTAVKIVDATAGAGSTEAYRMVRTLTEGGQCDGQPHERAIDYLAFVSQYRDEHSTIENIYGIDESNLSAPRRQPLTLALFLCAMPYNGVRQIDNAALSQDVPGDHGLAIPLHQMRREACLPLLEHIAANLVDAGDTPAHGVAFRMLMTPPLAHRHRAGVEFARLMLEKAYDPSLSSEGITRQMRGFAWLRLERAAESGDVEAMRMMITLLHEGRYRERDDKKAYFWILRLRRQGGNHPRAQDIEAALSDDDRTDVQLRDANCPISETIC